MYGLLVKCAALTVMIHGFRALGRLAGPRWSALALGLPSTTAVVLYICGCEQGSEAAITMAESGLLGLVAAVALPLAYAQAVRFDWRLPLAVASAVGGYLVVASTLGSLPAVGALPRIGLALLAILSGISWARRLPMPEADRAGAPLSRLQAMAVRTAVPAAFLARSLGRSARGRPGLGGAGEHLSQHVAGRTRRDPPRVWASRGEPHCQGPADEQLEHARLSGNVSPRKLDGGPGQRDDRRLRCRHRDPDHRRAE